MPKKIVFLSLAVLMVSVVFSTSVAAAESVELVGKCKVVGSANFEFVQLTDENGKLHILTGPYVEEFKRLRNIGIKVFGVKAGKELNLDKIKVYDYEILDVGKGVKPYFGTLREEGDGVRLEIRNAGSGFGLTGNKKVHKKLVNGVGKRAWVVGEFKENGLRVKKFRILAESRESLEMEGKYKLAEISDRPGARFVAGDGSAYAIANPKLEEIRHLAEARVRVRAAKLGKVGGVETIEVYDFEIVDIGGGVKPFFGTLLKEGDGLRLAVRDAGEGFALIGDKSIMDVLKKSAGSRAWIVGDVEDGTRLRVNKFRILSDATRH